MAREEKRTPVLGYALAAAAVIALDQWLKAWVRGHIPVDPLPAEQIPLLPGVIHLSHIHNEGVAFGMLRGGRWGFVALLGFFCALVFWALSQKKLTTPWERWLAVLAMGGALSNGVDRVAFGYVVDMLEVEFMRFAVFNLADCVICVSAALYALLTLRHKEPKPPEAA